MFIRRLTKDDYAQALVFFDALDELHCNARPDCFQRREISYPYDAFLQVISEPDCLMIGAFEEKKMLGLLRASVWRENTVSVCVDNLFVDPASRRRGIASALMKAVDDWALGKRGAAYRTARLGFQQGCTFPLPKARYDPTALYSRKGIEK